MDLRTLHRLIYLTLAGLWLAACASPPATPTPNLVETEVAVQRAAIATLTAGAPVELQLPTATPLPPTPLPEAPPATATASSPAVSNMLPTDTPAPPPTPTPEPQLPATPTPLPRCVVTANALNLRLGPGTVYEPPVLALPTGAELAPLAFSPAGFPSGQWLQVQLPNSSQSGWVSLGAQFITCNIDPATLPVGVAPPTPTPQPTPTTPPPPPPERVTLPPDGGKDASGLQGQIVIPFAVEVTSDGLAVFRDRLAFQVEVYDPDKGNRDGAGIREVTITIRDNNDERVHQRTERTAGYCVFGGGEPDCNVLVLAHNNYRWPDGDNMVSGKYNVTFTIVRDDGSEADWIWSFLLQR